MDNQRKPTVEELSKILGVSRRVVKSIQEIAAKGNMVRELDAPGPEFSNFSGGENTALSRLRNSDTSPLDTLEVQEEQERISTMLSLTMQKLSKEELIAIGMRYGLNGGEQANYREIADVLGMSSSRGAWTLVRKGVGKLQRSLLSSQRESIPDDVGSTVDQAKLHSMYSSLMTAFS